MVICTNNILPVYRGHSLRLKLVSVAETVVVIRQSSRAETSPWRTGRSGSRSTSPGTSSRRFGNGRGPHGVAAEVALFSRYLPESCATRTQRSDLRVYSATIVAGGVVIVTLSSCRFHTAENESRFSSINLTTNEAKAFQLRKTELSVAVKNKFVAGNCLPFVRNAFVHRREVRSTTLPSPRTEKMSR